MVYKPVLNGVSMRLLRKALKAFKYPNLAFDLAKQEIKEAFFWNYYYESIPFPKMRGSVEVYPKNPNKIVEELKADGLAVREYEIDTRDFRGYLKKAEYEKFPDYYNGQSSVYRIEKFLEHYLAAKLLNLSPSDVYLDVASCNSPSPEIYRKLYGCKTYRQDITFKKGVHGDEIGGNAAAMPVPDGFFTRMALHCSFEHFEGDSDSRFITEAGRVLAKGGKLCILPLYLQSEYMLQTDPACLPKKGIPFENEARLYCAKGWRNRFGRYYDVPHFISRVIQALGDLKITIYAFQNEKEVDKICYIKFAALLEK